jgi:hypothetical protein
MNIFYLDPNPVMCATYHNDRHVVKMILEHCQLLSTAHRILDKDCLTPRLDGILYKATHANHPSAIWVRQSNKNYLWLANMTVELCYEYTYRYGKIHKCQDKILPWLLLYIPKNIPEGPFTEPPQAMPEEVKVPGNSVEAYRKYYINNKAHLASWKNREVPQWYRSI